MNKKVQNPVNAVFEQPLGVKRRGMKPNSTQGIHDYFLLYLRKIYIPYIEGVPKKMGPTQAIISAMTGPTWLR